MPQLRRVIALSPLRESDSQTTCDPHSDSDADADSQITIKLAREPTTFFSLPSEIRNAIYSLVVIPSNPHSILLSKPQPALAKVNRQLRNEVLAVYYSYNSFVLPSTRRFKNYLDRVPEAWLGYLRCVELFVEEGWLRKREVGVVVRRAGWDDWREEKVVRLLHLKIRLKSGGEGVEILGEGFSKGVERAVGEVMRRGEGGVYTGVSLIGFALEMRQSSHERIGKGIVEEGVMVPCKMVIGDVV